MRNKVSMRKAHIAAFFACVFIACMYMISPAHAAYPLLETDVSGGCTWKYERIYGDTVLTIAPSNGQEGTLGSFSWNNSQHKQNTKRIVVKGTVKVGSSAEAMFKDFRQARSMDLSGLDVTGVTSMKQMFYDCHALTSLDVSKWNVSNVTDLDRMFCGCSALTSLDVSNWNVSRVTIMQSVFYNCSALTLLDVSNWNVSKVTNMWCMFHGCSALTSLDVSKWNVSSVTTMRGLFYNCSALTSLDVSNWNVSKVTNMQRIFCECSALTSLDLSNWNVSDEVYKKDSNDETWMKNIFFNTQSLKQISLGKGFYITDDAAFDDVGSQVGARWMQVNLGGGGTYKNPEGKVFALPSDLLAFHHDRTKRITDRETYVRIAPAKLTIIFNKGADDATGEMPPQVYDVGTTKILTKNAYKRAGYIFSGWKDPNGNSCADGLLLENSYFGVATQKGEVPQKTLELMARWKEVAILAYGVKEGMQITLSRAREGLNQGSDPLGSEVTAKIPRDKEVMWTVTKGGGDAASAWSYKGTKLGTNEIKAAAQKDGKLVSTTFAAEIIDKTYTITFDANVPPGTDVKGLPSPIVVKYGQKAQIPSGVTLSRPGYRFMREWNSVKDGKGVGYRAGSRIRNVFSHMTLYARWEKTPVLTYEVKEGTHIKLSCTQEEIDPSRDLLGTEVIGEVPEDKEVRWTVAKGGNENASSWSYTGEKLGKDEIKKAALKRRRLIPATFTAELVDRFYTITFDVNAPEGTKVQGQVPSPIAVKHGQMTQIPSDVTLSCPGYTFTGEWNDDKDGEGALYRPGKRIGGVFSHVTLYAQWEKTSALTYGVKEGVPLVLSCMQEGIDPNSDPLGTEVTSEVPEDKEVMWTVQEGGNEGASCWSYKGEKLEKDEIEKAALKDEELVSTTFIAKLVDKVYTITFDANTPSGTSIKGLPDPIVVKHGQAAQIPITVLSRSGYKFTGEWCDDKDGEGASYRAGSKIRNVFSHITLYAQWEEAVNLTDEEKKDAQGTSCCVPKGRALAVTS